MKKCLLAAFALLSPTFLPAQTAVPTAIPVEQTKTSLLSRVPNAIIPHDPQTNFRLFLSYTSTKNFTLKDVSLLTH